MEKPKYRLRREAWIDDQVRPPGTELTYEGKPGFNLEPINEAAHAMYAKYNPQPEGVPQMKVETQGGAAIGWESAALAAGWTPPGFAKVAESTPALDPPGGRATKPSGAAGVAGNAAAGGNQSAAGTKSADI